MDISTICTSQKAGMEREKTNFNDISETEVVYWYIRSMEYRVIQFVNDEKLPKEEIQWAGHLGHDFWHPEKHKLFSLMILFRLQNAIVDALYCEQAKRDPSENFSYREEYMKLTKSLFDINVLFIHTSLAEGMSHLTHKQNMKRMMDAVNALHQQFHNISIHDRFYNLPESWNIIA